MSASTERRDALQQVLHALHDIHGEKFHTEKLITGYMHTLGFPDFTPADTTKSLSEMEQPRKTKFWEVQCDRRPPGEWTNHPHPQPNVWRCACKGWPRQLPAIDGGLEPEVLDLIGKMREVR